MLLCTSSGGTCPATVSRRVLTSRGYCSALDAVSQLFLPTEREPPADAEALSHKLMVRAGLIRQVGAGCGRGCPAGWRVHQNAVQIVREEIDAIGGQEMLMPVLPPAELWKRSGRYAIDELFKLKDRRERRPGAGDDARGDRHVPRRPGRALLPRPAADPLPLPDQGARRAAPARRRAAHARVHHEGLLLLRPRRGRASPASYDKHIGAYDRIFDRAGLEWYRVESDVGMMGGIGAHEYMAPCPAGENEVALAPGLRRQRRGRERGAAARAAAGAARRARARSTRPGMTTIDAGRRARSGVPAGRAAEGLPGRDRRPRAASWSSCAATTASTRSSSTNALGRAVPARASPSEVAERIGPPGFIGPVGRERAGAARRAPSQPSGGYVAGANEPDRHLRGVEPGRDFAFERVDVRTVEAGRHA